MKRIDKQIYLFLRSRGFDITLDEVIAIADTIRDDDGAAEVERPPSRTVSSKVDERLRGRGED
jgi:hypothetical protein